MALNRKKLCWFTLLGHNSSTPKGFRAGYPAQFYHTDLISRWCQLKEFFITYYCFPSSLCLNEHCRVHWTKRYKSDFQPRCSWVVVINISWALNLGNVSGLALQDWPQSTDQLICSWDRDNQDIRGDRDGRSFADLGLPCPPDSVRFRNCSSPFALHALSYIQGLFLFLDSENQR